MFQEIRLIPAKVEAILARADELKEMAKHFRGTKDFVFLGRHFNHPTALEGALKLKEVSYIHASGYAGGEFKDGLQHRRGAFQKRKDPVHLHRRR